MTRIHVLVAMLSLTACTEFTPLPQPVTGGDLTGPAATACRAAIAAQVGKSQAS